MPRRFQPRVLEPGWPPTGVRGLGGGCPTSSSSNSACCYDYYDYNDYNDYYDYYDYYDYNDYYDYHYYHQCRRQWPGTIRTPCVSHTSTASRRSSASTSP